MKLTVTIAFLALASACSGDKTEAADGPAAESQVDTRVQDSVESSDAAESLPSLDEILPEQFAILTEPWLGDLDGMIERHAVRVLVVSGGPQFFYFQGKPRGLMLELLIGYQKHLLQVRPTSSPRISPIQKFVQPWSIFRGPLLTTSTKYWFSVRRRQRESSPSMTLPANRFMSAHPQVTLSTLRH